MRLLLVPLLFDDEGLVTAETNQVQRERRYGKGVGTEIGAVLPRWIALAQGVVDECATNV